MAQGWTAFKMKVGQNIEDNVKRAARDARGDRQRAFV